MKVEPTSWALHFTQMAQYTTFLLSQVESLLIKYLLPAAFATILLCCNTNLSQESHILLVHRLYPLPDVFVVSNLIYCYMYTYTTGMVTYRSITIICLYTRGHLVTYRSITILCLYTRGHLVTYRSITILCLYTWGHLDNATLKRCI